MYLLDTDVVSELRKRRGDSGVKQWVAGQSAADLAISSRCVQPFCGQRATMGS
jgi:predicted nucleic acid-binding protein